MGSSIAVGKNFDIGEGICHGVDAAIAVVAGKQLGNITRAQLLALGLTDVAIHYRVKNGRLFRVHHGVYSVGHRPVTPLERGSASVLACGEHAALSHGSAMTLWGLWKHWDIPFEVVVPGNRRRKEIRIHRSRTHSWRDLTRQHGIRVTTPARTLLDISPRLDDKALRRAVNNALNSPWMAESHLAELLRRHPNLPAAARIATMIGLPGTPTKSGWEDDFPGYCAAYDLPTPVMGAVVAGYIVDALFVEQKVIVELDGWDSHRGKIAFETDRERDAQTLAHGFVTVRATWERINARPGKEANRLHTILARRLAQC